jgi:subtilisin-like proprotein convertase family protein
VLFYLTDPGQSLPPGMTNFYTIDVTPDTTNVVIQILPNDVSPEPFPAGLQVYFDTNYPPVTPLTATNPAGLLVSENPAAGVYYLAIVNPANQPQPVNFDLKIYAVTNGPYGLAAWTNSYYWALSNLNSALSPWYRYESGTSMSAAAVSGLLGLVQEFLINNVGIMPSPALLKALLINGSSALNYQSDFNPNPPVNLQGWGLPNLANILPASFNTTTSSVVIFDQSPTNALQTGQWQNYTVNVTGSDTNWTNFPLRITLVWTDPPGNPAAGIALVNNLELMVTDVTTTNVYVGNDFAAGNIFTTTSTSNNPDAPDVVNNVQNVYIDATYGLLPPYTVSVRAAHVNVNAVTTQTNAIEQDYALVISSDDLAMAASLTVTSSQTDVPVTLITGVNDGIPLLHQRVGGNEANLYYVNAGNPLLDNTNGNVLQWHFFVFTNTVTGNLNLYTNAAMYTNAVFTTFLPPSLTFPNSTPPNLSVPAANNADIDLYVSTNQAILGLDPNAVSQSSKSLGRGGNETVFFTNTYFGQVFYIGVKSETQQGSDFAFFAEITTNFGGANGLQPSIVSGAPLPAVIPDSFLGAPGAYVVAPMAREMIIRKVAVQVGVQHSNPADLIGTIMLDGISDTLNHFTGSPGGFTNWYDDLPDGSIQQLFGTGTLPSEGPGSLRSFIGQPSSGSFILTEADAATSQTGMVTVLTVAAWPQPPNPLLFTTTIPPHGWYFGYVDVPDDATNLNIAVSAFNPAGGGPVGIYATNADFVNISDYGVDRIPAPGGALDIPNTNLDIPPTAMVNGPAPALTGGRWFYGITNETDAALTLTVAITIGESLTPNLNVLVANNTMTPLQTDAHTTSQICVDSGLLTNNQQLVTLQVGLRLNDTNLDDLVITLTSPQGTSVELFENRGGTNATQLGLTDTNGNYVYTTFTENSNLATTLIKFKPPPFAQPISIISIVSNSFEFVEGVLDGDYGASNGLFAVLGTNVEGWTVASNAVAVVATNDLYKTPSGSNFLALAAATFTQTIPTVVGQTYALTNLYRGPGLVDWWPFEGDANDIIGTNNGTIIGTLTNVSGVVGQGFMFNGTTTETNSVINFGATAGNFGTNDFTIDYWMNTTNAPALGPMAFLTKRAECGGGNFLEIEVGYSIPDVPGFLNLQLNDNGAGGTGKLGGLTSTFQVNDGLWHHVAWERRSISSSNSTLSLYVDGKLNVSANYQFVVNLDNAAPLLMGYSPCEAPGAEPSGQVYNYDGAVDEFDLWNRALTDVEVAAIYSAGTNGVGKATPVSIFPNIQYQINGAAITNVIAPASSAIWFTNTLFFTAVSNATTVTLQGNPLGMLLDDFILTGPTNANYVLPEESLAALNGQNPYGCWTLDVWDTRADSSAPTNGTLLSWNMQMTVSATNVNLIVLTNGIGYTNGAVPGNSIAYFAFDVPANANYVTNSLSNCSTNLNLLFNQAALPTGTQPGDFTLLANVPTNGGVAVLTNDAPAPSFVRGARYFLGVQNTNAGAATFTIEAETDQPKTNAILLLNTIPYTNTITNSSVAQYYYFPVPTNAVLASFEIINPTNEINLFVGNTLPLPDNNNYAYAASYAGTNDEAIVVSTNSIVGTTNSMPVPLTPGNWYLAVYNYSATTSTNPVTYQVVASYVTNGGIDIIPLTNGVAYTNGVATPGPALTNFYSFTMTNSSPSVRFIVTNVAGGNVDLIARDGAFPTPQQMTLGSFNSGTIPQVVTIVTNSVLPSLNGTWYLGVPNNAAGNVHYTISATTGVPGTNSYPAVVFSGLSAPSPTNGFTMNWQSVPGAGYEVDLTTNLSAWITATNFTATNTITTFTDPTPIRSQSARFYRVFRIH